MGERSSTKKIRSSIGTILWACFVILYIAGISHLEWIHSFTHEHAVIVSHTDEQENDPCHRSIYHGDWELGCHHSSHLVVADKCQMCDMACHGDQVFQLYVDLLNTEFAPEYFASIRQSVDSYWVVILSSRAPPANS